jgi:hypothetical protein
MAFSMKENNPFGKQGKRANHLEEEVKLKLISDLSYITFINRNSNTTGSLRKESIRQRVPTWLRIFMHIVHRQF